MHTSLRAAHAARPPWPALPIGRGAAALLTAPLFVAPEFWFAAKSAYGRTGYVSSFGDSLPIDEPSSVGLMGFALLCLAVCARHGARCKRMG